MRADMAKVVTERPRRGHAAPSIKTGRRLTTKIDYDDDVDTGRDRIKVSRLGQCRDRSVGHFDCHKEFSDLLGPLRGYLRKQVGRPWDKVYAELSATLDRRSISGLHIWDHVKQEVETQCVLGANGTVYEKPRYCHEWYPVQGLYVHPRTGLLMLAKDTSWPIRHYPFPPRHYDPALRRLAGKIKETYGLKDAVVNDVASWVFVDDLALLERRPVGWFIRKFKRLDPQTMVLSWEWQRIDGVKREKVPVFKTRALAGLPLFEQVECRQIGKREKKRYGVP